MTPHSDRLLMATSNGGGAASDMKDDSIAVPFMGTISLSEPGVPPDFSPSLAPTVDSNMFVDANGRKKRVWFLTVAPGTSPSELKGAKLKRTKCTGSSGTQFRVKTRIKKDHAAVVMNCALESVAIRLRVAGSVTLSRKLQVPAIQFSPTEKKVFSTTKDARQRYIPFGAANPLVHSTTADELRCSASNKRKKKKSKK
ncbi:uncharacterized protein LOC111244150 [Varroa destructor]|uniref:Uncharacterized protein n=1 Tax=Varroa destructor TaxID=109461 RepID=A0A7M7M3V3_VARDE|nr:uncharacterized protein LOC111244150 [Varroa destructor]